MHTNWPAPWHNSLRRYSSARATLFAEDATTTSYNQATIKKDLCRIEIGSSPTWTQVNDAFVMCLHSNFVFALQAKDSDYRAFVKESHLKQSHGGTVYKYKFISLRMMSALW